ncbi:hypothetical protein RJ641_010977, partial [Dillenia turbinata]
MDPNSVKSTLSTLAFGNVMAAVACDYQKELLAQEKAQPSTTANQEVDLDELMNDPELEKLHADRIAALKKPRKDKYREITEGDFLGEVTRSLAPRHIDTKFIKLDAENALFSVTKLAIKTLPCVVIFRYRYRPRSNYCIFHISGVGIAMDRIVGFQDVGGKDDFTTKVFESLLIKKGIISEKKDQEDEDDDYEEARRRTVRSSAYADSDSD